MKLVFSLLGHLLVTLVRLASPGGVRAVVAESIAVKHQLLIMKRSRRRAPNLTSWDRLMLGLYTLLVSSKRLRKMALITKASTLLRFHQALVKRKYHLLYGSQRPCVWRIADSGTKRWRSAGLRIAERALNCGAAWGCGSG
jgi:putative transposase